MCILPFNTPSIEPNGDVRLCSAASTYAYLHETNMGNVGEGGLGAVWSNARFRRIRQSLLTGEGLAPYCAICEYRSEGPPWVLQLHLALSSYNETRAAAVLPLIERHADRYEQYRQLAPAIGLWVEPLPDVLRAPGTWRYVVEPAGVRRIAFESETEWAEAVLSLPGVPLAALAECDGASILVRYHTDAADPTVMNLRVSLESDAGDILYGFPPPMRDSDMLKIGVHALRSDAIIPSDRTSARIRIGGFGPSGGTITIRSVAIDLGARVFETPLNSYRALADAQRNEIDRLSRDAAATAAELSQLRTQLSDLEAWLVTVRKALTLLPAPLRRIGKRLLHAFA